MARLLARREALSIFRLILIVKLIFLGLGFLAIVGLGVPARLGLLLRALPTLVVALLVVTPWLERPLGRSFLAIGLALDVFVESLDSAPSFFQRRTLWTAFFNVPDSIGTHLVSTPISEPFFFLLIPLVLLAWGYGRRGALLGSTWATVLHLGVGYWALERNLLERSFFVGVVARIALLFLVPLIVSVLAERERRQHAELEEAHGRLQRHAATVEQLAVSRERNRLARDLHDTMAHSLAALSVQLEAVRTLLIHDPAAAQAAVAEASNLARTGLEESRQAIQALRTDPLDTLGLSGAVRDMLQAFQARTGVQTEISVSGEQPELMAEEAQALYRIADEALTNVECHAVAQHVAARLAFGADRLEMAIKDDGVGFDPGGVEPDRFGLTGMEERAALIGAHLEVISRPGAGTEVRCTLQRE